jgi:hypothetical protein
MWNLWKMLSPVVTRHHVLLRVLMKSFSIDVRPIAGAGNRQDQEGLYT